MARVFGNRHADARSDSLASARGPRPRGPPVASAAQLASSERRRRMPVQWAAPPPPLGKRPRPLAVARNWQRRSTTPPMLITATATVAGRC